MLPRTPVRRVANTLRAWMDMSDSGVPSAKEVLLPPAMMLAAVVVVVGTTRGLDSLPSSPESVGS